MRVAGWRLRVASCGLRVAGCELRIAVCLSWVLRFHRFFVIRRWKIQMKYRSYCPDSIVLACDLISSSFILNFFSICRYRSPTGNRAKAHLCNMPDAERSSVSDESIICLIQISKPTPNLQSITYNPQPPTYNIQQTTYNIQPANRITLLNKACGPPSFHPVFCAGTSWALHAGDPGFLWLRRRWTSGNR